MPAEWQMRVADQLRSLRVHRLGRIAYDAALERQDELVAAKLSGDEEDHLLLLEHDAVYTLGRGARSEDLLGADQRLGVPVFRVGRGGGVTWHGPGQLVAYPIVALAARGRDVHRYIRQLEATLVATLKRFEIEAQTREGLTGVWVEERKIASIGVGVRRWVSFHGIALNVAPDLAYFRAVVPCAMPDVTMTSIERETGSRASVDDVGTMFEECFRQTFGFAPRLPSTSSLAEARAR